MADRISFRMPGSARQVGSRLSSAVQRRKQTTHINEAQLLPIVMPFPTGSFGLLKCRPLTEQLLHLHSCPFQILKSRTRCAYITGLAISYQCRHRRPPSANKAASNAPPCQSQRHQAATVAPRSHRTQPQDTESISASQNRRPRQAVPHKVDQQIEWLTISRSGWHPRKAINPKGSP